MNGDRRAPWAQSTAGVLVIQGVLGPVVGAIVGVVVTLQLTHPEKIDLPTIGWVALIVAAVIFIMLSLVLRKLRGLVWGNFGVLLRWIRGLRLSTSNQRNILRQAGYNKRSVEIQEERRRSPRPTWRVTRREGDDFIYVHNSGYWVEDVVVRADPSLFEFADGAPMGFIKGKLGDNAPGGSSGKQVAGRPTKKGEREGVIFEFSWTDQHGDEQPKTGGESMAASATLSPRVSKPVTRPTWQVGVPKQNPGRDVLMLVNGAEGFVGTNVIIDAEPTSFTFVLKRELGDIMGIDGLRFAGRPTEAGKMLGVTFTVTYNDANGDQQTDFVPATFGPGWGF